MIILHTARGFVLGGKPKELEQFSYELLHDADRDVLTIEPPLAPGHYPDTGARITIECVNAHIVYEVVRDDFVQAAVSARLVEWSEK